MKTKARRRTAWRAFPMYVMTIALGTVVLACGITDPDDRPFEASEQFTRSVPFSGQGQLRLDGVNGTIEIAGDPLAAAVTIEGTRRVSATSRREAQESLDELEVRVSPGADRVSVRSVHPSDSRRRSFSVDYRIVVPATFDLAIHTVNGRLEVTGTDGDAVLTVVNGDVVLTELTGTIDAGLVNGSIDADLDPSGAPLIVLETVNGPIDLRIPASVSAMIDAAVVNGTVAVSQLTLTDVVQTRTALHARLGTGAGTISLAAVNGDIRVVGH